jgi:chromosome condensin MukBEF complex kleisin-like MukF subunit
MPDTDLDLALRAVDRQAEAMQAIERKIAELYRRRYAAALADCEAAPSGPSGFAREILARPDRDQILAQMEEDHA